MELVTLHGARYAVGLRWYLFPGTRPLAAEARDRAKEILASTSGKTEYNAILLRPERRQVAFAQCEGPPPNVPGLASTLADARPGKWIARLRLPGDRMLVIACQDGLVTVDGDFIGTEEEATLLTEELKKKIGPDAALTEEDNAEAAQERLTGWLSNAKPNPPRLRQISAAAHYMKWWLSAAAVIAVGIVGYAVYSHYQAAAKERLEADREAQGRARVRQQLANMQQELAAKALAPVTGNIAPNLLLTNCKASFDNLALYSQGWSLVKWICDGRNITETWQFAPGASLTTLPAGAQINAKVAGEADGILTLPVSQVPYSQSLADTIRSATSGFFRLAEYASASNIQLSWQTVVAQASPGQGDTLPPQEAAWSMSLPSFSPFQVSDELVRTKGLSILSMTMSISNGSPSWQLQGKLYAKE